MEFNLIKEPIQKSINYADELFNQFNQENPKEIKFGNPQINFNFNKTLKNPDIIFFIGKYRILFEKNLNAFRNLYTKKDTFNGVLQYAKKINKDLNSLNNCLDNFNPNVYQRGLKSLKNDKIKELKKAIIGDLKKFNLEKDKFMKEFKRRNIEILNIVNTYFYLLIKLIKNIKKLSETLNIGYEKFNASEKYFTQEHNVKSGKYVINESYRQIALLVSEINNIFILTEKTSKKKSSQSLKKLISYDQSLKQVYKEIYQKINQFRQENNYAEVDPLNIYLGFEEIIIINDDCSKLENEMGKIYENIKNNYDEIKLLENEFRLDLLFILDTTSSMGYFLDKFKLQFLQIIQDIRRECPEAIVFTGLIGYKDIFDKELGDEYIDYDFTTNYEKLNSKIEEIEPDGGIDIPEDIPGAFELALDKIDLSWKGNTKMAILITDSPCHGEEFHDLDPTNNEQRDEYPDGDPEGRDIREMIGKFAKYKVSMFFLELSNITDKMFQIFLDEYKKELPVEAKSECSIESNLSDFKFIEKVQRIFYASLSDLSPIENTKKINSHNSNVDNDLLNLDSKNKLK